MKPRLRACRPGNLDPHITRHSYEPQSGRAALSGRRRPVHPGAARAVLARHLQARQLSRHDRHDHRRSDHARLAPAGRRAGLGPGAGRHRHRRRHRGCDRAPRADDLDAGTGGRLPLAGRHGGGAGGGGRLLRAGGLRHRHRRPYPSSQFDRNVARRRHRRHHLHRLGDCLPQAVGPHERQADHAAGTPRHQHRARLGPGVFHLPLLSRPDRARLLADRRHLAHLRRADHRADRRRRHAGRDLDAQLLFGVGGGRHRLHAW